MAASPHALICVQHQAQEQQTAQAEEAPDARKNAELHEAADGQRVLIMSDAEPFPAKVTSAIDRLAQAGFVVLGDYPDNRVPEGALEEQLELVAGARQARGGKDLDAPDVAEQLSSWIGGEVDVDLLVWFTPVRDHEVEMRYLVFRALPEADEPDDAPGPAAMKAAKKILAGAHVLPPAAEPPAWIPEPYTAINSIGFVIPRGTEGNLSVIRAGRAWAIDEGDEIYPAETFRRFLSMTMDFSMMITRFAVPEELAMVQVNVAPAHRSPQFNRAFRTATRTAPPELVDRDGQSYPAVGFTFTGDDKWHVRYTRNRPIRSVTELPRARQGRPHEQLRLLFLVDQGADLAEFRIGRAILEEVPPGLDTQ